MIESFLKQLYDNIDEALIKLEAKAFDDWWTSLSDNEKRNYDFYFDNPKPNESIEAKRARILRTKEINQ